MMASHKAVVEAYVEGFRRTDHEAILACLADDIVWVLHGYRTPAGQGGVRRRDRERRRGRQPHAEPRPPDRGG
ncbi:MAG: hypothetical protein ACRD0W_02435 [Acidimicrobiales bacterium]